MSNSEPSAMVLQGIACMRGLYKVAIRMEKVRPAVAINEIVAQARLSQTAAAERLGINQPKISALANYRLEGAPFPRSAEGGVFRPLAFLS